METCLAPPVQPSSGFSDSLLLLGNFPDAILIMDAGGLIVYSNHLLDKVFAYDANELMGKSVECIIPEYHQVQDIEHQDPSFRSSEAQVMSFNDLRGLRKNGEELHLEIKLSPYLLNDIIFFMVIVRDVTERYWEKLRLKERENRLRTLLESVRGIPWAADPACWCFTYVGPQAVELLGYPIEKWYETDFWASRIHPDDREKTINGCVALSKTHDHYEFEYRMLKSDGSIAWFRDIVSVEQKNGVAHILRGFLIDITAHRDIEQKSNDEKQLSDGIIKSLPGLFFMFDRQGRYVRWNKNTELLHGLSGDEMASREATDFVSRENQDQVKHDIERGFRDGEVTSEYERLTKDGRKTYYIAHAVRTCIGEEDYLVGIELDISKQKRMERDASRLRNELAHVNRLATMGELTASIAHELNQPLAAIMSNAQAAHQFLTKPGPDLEEVNAALADIISDDRRAGEIIKGLRKLLVKGQAENVALNIADLIVEVVKLIKNEARNKNINIVVENNSPDSSLIMGDRIQLQQVVLNLILNAFDAIKKTENSSRKLVISIIKNTNNKLTVEVMDNGIGFEQQDVEQLFRAFHTSKQKGMGMGLTISRTIIESHGGQLGAMQNNTGGAIFYFTLPIALVNPA